MASFKSGSAPSPRWLRGRSTERRARLVGVAGLLLLSAVIGRNLTNDVFVRDGALLFWSICACDAPDGRSVTGGAEDVGADGLGAVFFLGGM